MSQTKRTLSRATAVAGIGILTACLGYAAVSWLRYGRRRIEANKDSSDSLLDRFMPQYEVADHHRVRVNAPAETTFLAETKLDLSRCGLVRAIFKGRELLFGSLSREPGLAGPLPQAAKRLGWGALAEIPGREIVLGAITQPWVAHPEFRALPPEEFASFDKPGFLKIVWTLRADPAGPAQSFVSTETRVLATDPRSRRKFRLYWAFLSPGIIVIRKAALALVKKDAERAAGYPAIHV